MPTSFCSACGHENDGSASICPHCGGDLEHPEVDTLEPLVTRIRWRLVALYAALVVAPLVLTHLVPALRPLALGFRVDRVLRRVELSKREALARVREALPAEGGRLGDAGLVDGQYVYEEAGRLYAIGEHQVALSDGGLARIGWPLLFCLVAAVVAVGVGRRRIFREVALAGVAVAIVMVLLWLRELGWRPGLLLRGDLFFVKEDGQQLQMPAKAFLAWSLVLIWIAGVTFAYVAALVVERVTRRATCARCGRPYRTGPSVLACPHCRTAVAEPRVDWRWVGVAVASSTVAYVSLMLVAGPRLHFYHHCDYYDPSARCRAAMEDDLDLSGRDPDWRLFFERHGDPARLAACRTAFLAAVRAPGPVTHRTLVERCRTSYLDGLLGAGLRSGSNAALGCAAAVLHAAQEDASAWGACPAAARKQVEARLAAWQPRRSYLVFYHYWKFILVPAPLFVVAPLLLALLRRRNPMATAGAVIPLAWLAAAVAGFVFLHLAGFEGAFFVNLQTYIVALVFWGAAGVLGALVGHFVGSRRANAFTDLEED